MNGIAGDAAIICIGDELLIGQVVNTNASFIAEKANGVGISVARILTVGDDENEIVNALKESTAMFDVVFTTGGLGPTHDDLTRSAACKFFKTDLVLDKAVLTHIKSLMHKRNLPWSQAAEDQAMVPRNCTVIPNAHGTAPGMLFERGGKHVFIMPGVPYEMKGMMESSVLPLLRQKSSGKVVCHRTLKTTGIPESFLASKLPSLDELLHPKGSSGHGAKLAFLPSPLGVSLRITVVDVEAKRADDVLTEIERQIRENVEKYIYGVDDDELEAVVGKLLAERKLLLAVAESCTGGLITDRLTNVPGSSKYLERGVVAYSNQSKLQFLGVPPVILERHGAVSKEVAQAMAEGVRRAANTDIGISTTGIAGPTGATPEKPIGLVWIGYADVKETLAVKFHFGEDRIRFKERASQAALELVRRKLLKIEPQQQGKY